MKILYLNSEIGYVGKVDEAAPGYQLTLSEMSAPEICNMINLIKFLEWRQPPSLRARKPVAVKITLS